MRPAWWLPALVMALGVAVTAPAAAETMPATSVSGAAESLPVTVEKPAGPGPFPAVVIAHDCSGLGATSSGGPGRWARALVSRNYVVIVPDSFTTRGFPGGVCTDARPRRGDVSPSRRAHDVYAALAYARGLGYVDGRRVGLMGASHGGSTTLAAMRAPDGDGEPLAAEKRAGFAAALALYPACAPGRRAWQSASGVYRPIAPFLILIGEKDDWTPAAPCEALTEAARSAGFPVTIKVYPGAHHSFDSAHPTRYVARRINPNAEGGRGATTGGDPRAWADAIREVAAFFGRHLAPSPAGEPAR